MDAYGRPACIAYEVTMSDLERVEVVDELERLLFYPEGHVQAGGLREEYGGSMLSQGWTEELRRRHPLADFYWALTLAADKAGDPLADELEV